MDHQGDPTKLSLTGEAALAKRCPITYLFMDDLNIRSIFSELASQQA
jgi:hypothetical protein